MKLRTLISIPLLVAALGYIGLKGYIYYKVKTELDKMIQVASPVLQIEYSGIGSKLSGTVSIDRVLLTPSGSYDEISIQRLEVSGDGPGFLLDLVQGFNKREPPAKMAIAVHQLESPISSSFLSSIGSPFGKNGSGIWKAEVDSCSLAGILKASGLRELGFPELTINGGMDYNYDKETGEIQFSINYELAGVESSSFHLKASGLTTAGIMGLGKLPVFEQLHLVRNIEPGYMKQIVTLCATNSTQPPDQFIDTLLSRPGKHYLETLGFIPGPGLSAMFRQLITNAGELDIQANPSSEINPANLSAYRPRDLIDLLGISVSYNNKPVTDLSFSTQLKKQALKPKSAKKQSTARHLIKGENQSVDTKPVHTSRPKLRFIETDISELANYLRYRVRIYTLDNDKPKLGQLVSIKNQTINVEQLLYSGKMTVHLHSSRITKVEVLRSE